MWYNQPFPAEQTRLLTELPAGVVLPLGVQGAGYCTHLGSDFSTQSQEL